MTRTLVVIDIQNDYFEGGVAPLWQADEVEAAIVAAIGRARAAGDRVILVRHVSAAATGLFAAGGTGAEIRPAILEAAGDAPVVEKRVADAFRDTGLAALLTPGDELLICGMMTQNCVAFTAMSRAADAYQVKVVRDLCAAPTAFVHGVALNALGSKLTLVEAAGIWGAQAASA